MIPTRPILAFALAFALALSAVPAAAQAPAPPKGMTAGPSIEGISEYTLDNGLRVLLFPDPTKPAVTVNLVYGVGSAHEDHGQTGMAHLLEHLLFKGTPAHADISGEMKRRGIAFNATTSLDRTSYFASFPASEDTLAWVLRMEADRMVDSRLAQSDLDSEMTVVRNELEAGENNPSAVLIQRLRSTAFLWHAYGRSTIGARSDVEAMDIGRLRAFYRTWYRPDNATLVIAGRIDPAAVLGQVRAAFGPLRKPTAALPQAPTVEPAQDGEREVTVRRSGDLRLVAAAYHIPARAHADSAALAVLVQVLGHTPGGRLHRALVEPHIAAGIGASAEARAAPGLLTAVAVQPREGDPQRAQEALLAQLEGIAAQPVTEEETAQARQRLANDYALYFTDVNAVGMGLSESIAAGDWRLLFTSRDAIAAVTAEDVNRVASAYLRASNRTLARFVPTDAPDRVEVPSAPAAADVVAGYAGREAVDAGEHFEATPANIEARTRRVVLGEGLKVALLPKRTRGGTVVATGSFRFGDAASLAGRGHVAGLVGAMLMRGSQGMDRVQIDRRLEALQTKGGVGGGLQGADLSLLSRREHLPEALALMATLLREPAFPQDEFEQLRLQAITGLEASRKEPGSIAGQALALHFDPWPAGHPLHVDTLDESLAKVRALTREDLVAFHRDFYGTAQGEIAIVGDFDAEAMQAQLQALFAGWRSAHPYAPIDTRHTDVAPLRERLPAPDKPNAVLLARHNLALRVTDADYPAMVVANRVFGGGALKSRLGDRIRQKEGLSYGVSSALSADDSLDGQDDAGAFAIQAIAAPQNMDRVQAAIGEELVRLVADGITAEELRDGVSGLMTEREQARGSDATVAAMLRDQSFFGRTMRFTADLDDTYRALTLEQVNAAIRRHLRPDALSAIAAGDFAAAVEDVPEAVAAP
ncbi:peptidase M16 [Pseudoxanthomonas broegbernensis]|uniref:Peptidase M16 n=1 Tax=Pseudoxanthomonas broegbernensis TaxID=83619 RepID=A0A7V8GNJ7_9GAMM|nr:pitrilysin family protein [Pseudoxanthomonas broegbernensis]KAF1687002.1 peptidase M16 [Pseudoxanthomonas broegbernensis]MBB6065382.1 zinc protease [Pseudoxanthomonas broegbernensis]